LERWRFGKGGSREECYVGLGTRTNIQDAEDGVPSESEKSLELGLAVFDELVKLRFWHI
jgi:hypothetical protein